MTAYVLPARDEPAPASAPAQTAIAADNTPRWFSAAPLMPRTAGISEQEPGRPLAGRNGRIVELGGLDVAQYIAQREGAARLGDMKAVYEVYQAEALCANLDAPLPETLEASDHEQLARARAQQRALCAHISPVQVQERMRYLKLAADAGNTDAQIDYFIEGPGGQPVDLAASADDPAVKQWKQDAMNYLKTAGAHCNSYALALLANAYDAGSIAERDAGMAVAYGIASARARNLERTPEQWKQQFGDELSNSDFNAALERGTKISDSACQH